MNVMGYSVLEEENLPSFLKELILASVLVLFTSSQSWIQDFGFRGLTQLSVGFERHVMLVSQMEVQKKLKSVLSSKPKWATCLAFAAAILITTAVAVTTGVFIGYTYCYLEHRSEAIKGNKTHSADVQIVRMTMEDQQTPYNRTINGALASNYIISKILKISGVLVDGDVAALPFENHSVEDDLDYSIKS